VSREEKGSASFQLVLVGILPTSPVRILEHRSANDGKGNGRMPLPAGWKPALPFSQLHRYGSE
jgi:hypothetical protein